MKTKDLLLMIGKAALKNKLNGETKDKAVSNSAPAKDDLPPGIAREGEKVIAIKTDLNMDEDTIMRGEILTVRRYHLGSYCFEERPAHYNPYLGDIGNPLYPASAFRTPDETATQIIAFLDDVEVNVSACCDQMLETIKADQTIDRDSILQFALHLKEHVEQIEQENLQRLFQNCKAKENREVFSLDVTQLMINQLTYELNICLRARCAYVHQNQTLWEKLGIRLSRNKKQPESTLLIDEAFSVVNKNSKFAGEICNQYAEYILRYIPCI